MRWPSVKFLTIGKPNKTDFAKASLMERCSKGLSELDRYLKLG